MNNLTRALILFILVGSGLFACKKVVKNEAYYETVSKYIYAFTSGDIGQSDPIRVRFVEAAVSEDKAGTAVDAGVFSISPAIPGTTIWEDQFTILFTPDEPMPHGKEYAAMVSLGKLFKKVPSEVTSFAFDFKVRALSFDLASEGLMAADLSNLSKQQIKGTLRTSDPVDGKAVEEVLSAKQGVKQLAIKWSHSDDGRDHHYVVEGVERTQTESKVVLEWSGTPLGVEKKGSDELFVPALGDFYVLDARVVQEEEQYVRINFSDPILAEQDLAGLVRIMEFDGNLKFVIDRNTVRVYPSQRIVGEHTLRVEEGVRNSAGAGMKEKADWTLEFEDMKPGVRLVGRGAIIPKNEKGQVVFPFEAVGLKAVDVEVFKIYNSSVLQYLQVNELEGVHELHRVGKIVLQKKVDLESINPDANPNAWQRYALNLNELIQKDPAAVYQVRLAFRMEYTVQDCTESFSNLEDFAQIGTRDEAGLLKSVFGGYRGIYFEDNGQNWWWYEDDDENSTHYQYRHRDNPCKREYYCQDHFTSRNVFASDLGLMAKRGDDGSIFAVVTDLNSTAPLANVNLEFFNYQLQAIGKATTDATGTITVTNLRERPFVMVAKQGGRYGYLRMADGGTLSLSRFDVAGVEAQKGLKGFLYAERGVWRPGDSLFLNFVLEDKTGLLPIDHPLSFELKDPRGTVRHRYMTTESVNGVYALHCATNPDAPTGNWTATVKLGGAQFSKNLKIETVKPNRLKLDLDFGKDKLASDDNNLKGKLTVNWLHGAPAQNLKAQVEMRLQATQTQFANYRDFVFDDPARRVYTEPQVLFDSKLDADGKATVPFKSGFDGVAAGMMRAQFRVRAFEAGGDFSTDNFSLDYYPYQQFIGISIPTNRWGSKELNRKGDQVRFVCVDASGKPLANKKLEVGIYRCDWRWWWDEDSDDNVAQFNSADHFNALDRATIQTDSRGIATWKVKPSGWGRYLVRASLGEGEHATGDFFWSGNPGQAQDIQSRNAAAMLPFSVDKETYQLGEEVVLKVPASEDGRILLTLENGTKVVQHVWYEAKSGDNTIRFKATEEMVPTVYAHISLFQPHAQTKNDLPIRMYGVMPVNIENQATHLKPVIAMQDVIKPGKEFTVNVREASGLACAYTLAIVDEGLLDLTRFETPDPWNAFFAREALGVKTWDIYDYVLGAYGVELERLLSIGGDAFNRKAQNAAQVNRFKPVVKHIGPFYLEKGQTANHTFTIDNYVGSVRVMAVCSAPNSGGKGAYGSAEKTCPVRQPLMIMPTLPRVLGPNETLSLPVDVFAMESSVKNATVRVTETSGLVSVSQNSKRLKFEKPGQQLTYFDLKVGKQTGVARFQITAEGNGEKTSSSIELMVRNPNPVVTKVLAEALEPGKSWTATFDPEAYSEMEAVQVEVSALPPINMSRHMDYLLRYPHGCVEQTTSAAFPQLFASLIAPINETNAKRIDRNIKAAIEKMEQFQNTQGGFSYWPGGNGVADWGTCYAGHFLLEAQRKGYKVPPQLINRWVGYQTRVAKRWLADTRTERPWYSFDSDLTQAYRLYTLALAGKPALGDMNRLRERKDLYAQAAYLLAAAYAQIGKPEIARQLSNAQWKANWKYAWGGSTYGSDLRDESLMLETLVAIGDTKRAESVALSICKSLGGDRQWYWNTQTLATALRALSRYAEKGSDQYAGPKYSYQTGSNGQREGVSTHMISTVDVTETISSSGKITISNKDAVRLYARVTLNGRPLAGNETKAEEHVSLAVRYTDLKGNPLDVSSIKQGTDFVAEVTVSRKDKDAFQFPFQDMALNQVFPSGWEILNTRMNNNINNQKSSPSEYQDIRDDRVYTYFDIPGQRWDYRTQTYKSGKGVYRIQLNAAYKGRYFLPAVEVEAMYDNRVFANTVGQWVEVI